MHCLRPKFVIVYFLTLLTATAPPSAAQEKEYQIKAAYLYNLAKITQWPAKVLPENSPLIVGVFGGDEEFATVMRGILAGKSVNGHSFEVRQVHSPGELKSCHVAFFGASSRATPVLIEELRGSNVLLIGEEKDFLDHGGMINLIFADGRVSYGVNSAALHRSGLIFGGADASKAKDEELPSAEIQSEGTRPVVSRVAPVYPRVAAAMNLKGTVQLQAVVKADGVVKEVHVVGGHPVLAQAAIEAIRKWRYEPGPKETTESVKVSFGE